MTTLDSNSAKDSPVTTLRISTFGGLSLQQGDSPVTGFVSRKVEALLVYMACNPREHPREVLAEMLWDDLPQARTMANLRTALSSLQAQLASHLLVTRHALGVDFSSGVWVDALALDTVLNEAERQMRQNNGYSRGMIAQLENALALYRGIFLEGFHIREARGFEEWMVMEQERLRGRVIEAMQQMTQHALNRGQYAEGIQYATRLLQIAPLWEETHRQLMLLLALSGQRSGALAQYEICRRLLKDELGVSPDDETEALHRRILDGTITAAPESGVQYHLPHIATAFVDRPSDLDQIGDRLESPDCRLLTLVGPGGMGKTRLAIESARRYIPSLSPLPIKWGTDGGGGGERENVGVYFVPLASVNDVEFLAPAIANALKIALAPDTRPEDELVKHLRDAQMLVVLDNFEQLLDGAELLSKILLNAPAVKLLVTSRERLNLHEEWVYMVEGLPFPEDERNARQSEALEFPAVQLFVQSARRVRGADYVLNGDGKTVAHICRLVEGMPLGIELAASWLGVMTPAQVAAQIEHDLDFLATSLRNVPERHRSLRVLFEHSLTSLTDAERMILFKLAILRGGFDRDAASAVAGASLMTLASLMEKSLIRFDTSGRYDMHELLRRFSIEKLIESGQHDAVQSTYCAYFAQYADTLQEMAEHDDQLDLEYGNIRSALEWAVSNNIADGLRLASALTFYWRRRAYINEGRQWFDRVLTVGISERETITPLLTGLRAKALFGAGVLAWAQSDFDAARAVLQDSLVLCHEADDKIGISNALRYLGYIALNTGHFDEAQRNFETILTLARERSDQQMMLVALGNLGHIAGDLGDLDTGIRYMRESLTIARSLNNLENVAVLLTNIGNTLLAKEDFQGAKGHYEESLELAKAIKYKASMMFNLINLGEVMHNLGDYAEALARYRHGLQFLVEVRDKLSVTATLESIAFVLAEQGDASVRMAVQLLGAAQSTREALDTPILPREQTRYDKYFTLAKNALSEADFAQAWDEGRALSLDQAVARVLDEPSS